MFSVSDTVQDKEYAVGLLVQVDIISRSQSVKFLKRRIERPCAILKEIFCCFPYCLMLISWKIRRPIAFILVAVMYLAAKKLYHCKNLSESLQDDHLLTADHYKRKK